ncbi:MAG: hypothetical protein LBE81_03165 [Azonexus sp.]|jgi:formate-dependent nitrite reductase membrane component NrfD|uniref:hypothetical protein n=1 Tax=Azonexus sp. TaxID=1872668 RepID=UPI002825B92F|nr:hypothetical protein [Azonexus sp.]MDR0775622.1 hypothetical protein [Azonexus sp.]
MVISPKRRIAIGCAMALGPIAVFLFVSTFSAFFSSNTILFWRYVSAFGFAAFGPLGLIAIIIGVIIHQTSHKKPICQMSKMVSVSTICR